MCVNRQTLSSGLGPDSLWGSEWVRHGYQQQAQAASVSALPHKESACRDIGTNMHTPNTSIRSHRAKAVILFPS